ncbi:hypothetical protein FQN57_001665 [Myotisia sp. PD_48]|nr:hypothetical protein FQN57_001665 [Myotisia sp. PD_48]
MTVRCAQLHAGEFSNFSATSSYGNMNQATSVSDGGDICSNGASDSTSDYDHDMNGTSPRTTISQRKEVNGANATTRSLDLGRRRRRRVLLSTSTPFADTVVRSLYRDPDIELRLIAQHGFEKGKHKVENIVCYHDGAAHQDSAWLNSTATSLAEWAELLIISPMDAGSLGAMLCGLTTSLTLTILRGWDVAKTILLVPGMTIGQWTAPITKRQLDELRRFWPSVNVLPPILSKYEVPERLVELPWEGREKFYDEIRKDLKSPSSISASNPNGILFPTRPDRFIALGQQQLDGIDESSQPKRKPAATNPSVPPNTAKNGSNRSRTILPPELLCMVFEFLGDWELATAVGVYTNMPIPQNWRRLVPTTYSDTLSLEYTILRRPFSEIKKHLLSAPSWRSLSNTATGLIYKFSRIDILEFLYFSRSDIYLSTHSLSNLPYCASGVYGNTTLLDWWYNCPDMPNKDTPQDAMDSASRAGFVHILDWWRKSGLPCRYTERALESASAGGKIAVLDWWKNAGENSSVYDPLQLKIGKSVLFASQSGRTDSIAWWDRSKISYPYADSVARIASTYGHVRVLELWYQLKGSKMIFDNQVLVGATKNGHVDVLEWWRRSGLHVEFKTCDIEEALEDAVSGAEERVRQWWERNGLNLGVGTSEWMKTKVL